MKTFLILLLSALLLMGCVVPEIPSEVELGDRVELSIVSFVQEINCNGVLYKALGGMSCTVLCNLVSQNCPQCQVNCPTCEDCEECPTCEVCEECEICEVCEECTDNTCCYYFTLQNLYITVRAEGTGSIKELCFLITYNDGTTSSICVDVDWTVDGSEEKEIEVIVSGRVVFVTLM